MGVTLTREKSKQIKQIKLDVGNRIDGIIFYRPVNEFTMPHIEPKIFTESFLKRINKRTNGEVKSVNDIFIYIKSHHPTLASECERHMRKLLVSD